MNRIMNFLALAHGDLHKRLVFILMSILTINSVCAMENSEPSATASSDSINTNQISDDLISRNLFVEFGGPTLGVGIGYDQRFKPNSVFGFRAGVSFTNGSFDDGGWWGAYYEDYTKVDFSGVTLPLEANAIMGKRASKFELGVGATPCILKRTDTNYLNWHHYTIKQGVRLNIFGTLNVGYRLQRKSGFFLRAGLTFLIGDLKCSPLDGLLLIPNLSLGYTIR